jgi:uncharacterized surface protein with fasciclin (FAS1) repeats
LNRLLTAAATLALAAGLAAPQMASAQAAAQAKTEGAAAAATGKATTDAPAATAVQGTAKAVQAGAVVTAPVATLAKPVAASGDLMDTLRLSGQFTTFVGGVDATNLTTLLKTNKNLTVFAPTDAAFAAMPPAELARLKGDKAAMQKFVLHHVVNAPIPSSKIKGAKGPVPTGAGDQITLDGSDEGGQLRVDGSNIVQADLQTTSGLLQIVDKVLVPGATPPATAAVSGTAAPASATAPATPPAKQ